MAWLCLDTHVSGRTILGLLGPSGWLQYQEIEGRAHHVLAAWAQLHTDHVQDIQGVCVVEGPGSFSAIRIGVLYANLYARLRHLPLVPIGPSCLVDPTLLFGALSDGTYPPSSYVAPLYDQEPNITIPRA
jgi:hypothetical protein